MALSGAAQAEMQLVPNIVLGERYDTNVLMRGGNAIPGDFKKEDFVTTIIPQLTMRSREGLVDMNGLVGVIGEVYARNPGLNYIGVNGAVGLGLTPLVSRVLQNATLNISGTVLYTPLPPAFLTPGQDSPFFRGIQYFRSNTLSYSAGETFLYRFSPRSFVQSAYRYYKIEFLGNPVGGAALPLIGASNHQAAVTPGVQVSANDTITNSYTFNFFEQVGIGSFRTHTDTLGWRRAWSPNWSTQINAGAQYIEPQNFSFGGQTVNQPGFVIPTGSISLVYGSQAEIIGDILNTSGQLIGLDEMPGVFPPGGIGSVGNYTLRFSYNYLAYPLLLGNGGLVKSHVLGMSGTLGLAPQLTAVYGGNFARNTGTVGDFRYESIAGNFGLNYLVSPSLRANVMYTYINTYSSGAQAVNLLSFNRQTVMFTLTYAFGGGNQYFQGMGYFGGGGGPVR